jgi:hypothetical protein
MTAPGRREGDSGKAQPAGTTAGDGSRRSWAALALQAAAFALIAISLLGASWLDPRSRPHWLVLVDRSDSMPRPGVDAALAVVQQAAGQAGTAPLQSIDFAGRAVGPLPQGSTPADPLDAWTTNIEAALQLALQTHARTPLDGIVVISDGFEHAGDAAQSLRAARDARLPVRWMPVARPAPAVRLAEVRAPREVLAGQRIAVAVQLAGRTAAPLRVAIRLRPAEGGAADERDAAADATGRSTGEFDTTRPGLLLVDVRLQDAGTGQTLDSWTDAAVVEVVPRAAMLYARGSDAPLARSLLRGGWTLDVVPASRLDAQTDALEAYAAVVLDDVAVADAGPRFWDALARAVQTRGLGLTVLGGDRAFALGGYRGSTLESLLPVLSEPPALGRPVAVLFAVDKSGSMGEGSGGVDRFGLAQRAVLETARGLDARDSLGLVVFDVAPRVLLPLGPSVDGLAALQRDWPAVPQGGTRLAPALEAAIAELERAGPSRRLLVLVTDGFVDDAPIAELRARLARSRIETIALAVGPDADLAALRRLVGEDAGTVVRVDQAAELPLVMRASLERRRSRIERGQFAVTQREALPFAPRTLADWPPVQSYAVTRPRAEARVAVQSERGDPLIAFLAAGRGRTAAVTSGFGPATRQWLSWSEWPALAGGLADWTLGSARGDGGRVAVTDLANGLLIELDQPVQPGQPAPAPVSVAVDTPTAQALTLAMEPVAPGRWRAVLADAPPGLYRLLAAGAGATQAHWHLRAQRGERDTWGTSPALQAWQEGGLVAPWDAAALRQAPDAPLPRAPDRSLLALGLLLAMAGIVVDRTRLPRAGAVAWLRRWQDRLQRRGT